MGGVEDDCIGREVRPRGDLGRACGVDWLEEVVWQEVLVVAMAVHDRVRAAADADRRSVSNWVAVACERALDAAPQAERSAESEAIR